jgi:hypothetical protein
MMTMVHSERGTHHNASMVNVAPMKGGTLDEGNNGAF